jgi:HSP20 family molecular chaperone IbpA
MENANTATKLAEAPATQPTPARGNPVFVEAEQLFEQMKELTQTIAQRAYEFFETRGYEFGKEVEDWFRAEAEVLRHVPVELSEDNANLIMRAEVPGFKAEEIKVSVEPQRLIISAEQKAAQTVYTEWRANRFCRTLPLPTEVDPAQVTATLKGGILQLTLPKVAQQEAVQVAVQTA